MKLPPSIVKDINLIGQKLLLWAIEHIRKNNNKPITLHVAKWNEKALKLYLDNGFEISKIEKIR